MEKNKVNEFKNYIHKQLVIDSIDTFIILPQYYEDVQNILHLNLSIGKMVMRAVESTKNAELYPAVIYNTHFPQPWFHMLCYKDDEAFYHVHYHSGWICRECQYDNGAVLMPMSEANSIYYAGSENRYPPTPSIFKKIACDKCGKMLQNHLIRI